jgi:predicted nucleic acid-binding protein
MPEGFLFDTVTCSRWRRGDRMLRCRIEALSTDAALYTSVMSVGELMFGIHNAPSEYQERLQGCTESATISALGRFISRTYVEKLVSARSRSLYPTPP